MNIGQPNDPQPSSPSTADSQDSSVTTDAAAMGTTAVASSEAANEANTQASRGAAPLAAVIRGKGPLAARGLGAAKPASPVARPDNSPSRPAKVSSKSNQPQTVSADVNPGEGLAETTRESKKKQEPRRPRLAGESAEDSVTAGTAAQPMRPAKVTVPNLRQGLSEDLMAEMERELASADIDGFLSGSAGMANRKDGLEEGQRVHGTILKIHNDSVFVTLGGPDEGVIPFLNFTGAEPKAGDSVEVIIRGINKSDGLYVLTLPGEAVDVSEWEDIEPGTIVEATITGSNAGGLECKVGSIRGFMPISQISEHRIEDTTEFIDQKMICIVTESNQRRGNLVLSRRAVLEREREDKRKEQLEKIEAGDLLDGVVRSIKDFGAFVDLGGLDGLIHISKLSWDRIKHPSEVLEVGQKVKVKIDKIDKQTGKMSLSYRDLLENPWTAVANTVAVGAVMTGAVTRIANFGAFVRLAAGVEGLVHISEVANHRVSNVEAFVKEGQEVEVKVLSIDTESQKISLSMKQAHSKPVDDGAVKEDEIDEPAMEPVIKAKHSGPLRGGNDRAGGGERFGLRW